MPLEMSHLGETVTEVTTSNPSAHKINDPSARLLTRTIQQLMFTMPGFSLFVSYNLCNVSRSVTLSPSLSLPLLWWPRLERRNETGRGVGKERERGGGCLNKSPFCQDVLLPKFVSGREGGMEGDVKVGWGGGGMGNDVIPLHPGQ